MCRLLDESEWHNDGRGKWGSAMTGHANSLTAGAMPSNSTASSKPTMPAHDFRVFLDALGRLGYDAETLLAGARVQAVDLAEPDARVPCDACGAMIARACQERYSPNLAVHLATATPTGAWPLIDYLVLTADTVSTGMRQLARYIRVVEAPFTFTIHDDVDPVCVRITTDVAAAPFAIEFEIALTVLRFREQVDGPFQPGISLAHALADAEEFAAILACPVETNALWSGISMPRQTWELPLRRRDPILRHVLEEHANEVLNRLPARTGLAFEVQRLLATRVAGGDPSLKSIGSDLGISSRTLQRRLTDEGVSFHRLLDDTRKGTARRYLVDSTLAIGEIAYLLGYSETAAFHRAFKRWYGQTPDAFRKTR
jgi:AraC-like DNA-binding protein